MSWLDEVVARYGQPKLSHTQHKRPIRSEDEFGLHTRKYWVWFPGSVNHNVTIGHYEPQRFRKTEFWVVRVGSHKKHAPQLMLKLSGEPDDEDMRSAFDVSLFFQTPEEIDLEIGNKILGMTLTLI